MDNMQKKIYNLDIPMPQQFKVIQKWRYEVFGPENCTVSDTNGNEYCTSRPGEPARFIAHTDEVILSSDLAHLISIEGNAYDPYESDTRGTSPVVSVTGERIQLLNAPSFSVQHATWFDNAAQIAITVIPAAWKNEVMTCYLKTAVPVELSGVTWLYGEPAMMAGFSFVVALQQIDATTVLANLAYSLKQ